MTPSKELSAAGPSHFQPGRPLQWPFYQVYKGQWPFYQSLPRHIANRKANGRFIKADGRFIKESFDAVFKARLGSRT